MRIQLIVIDGKDIGYTLVPEDHEDKILLKRVQNMHFLASSKQEKICYDGVTLDQSANVGRVIFLQHKYSVLPTTDKTKREIHKAIIEKVVQA